MPVIDSLDRSLLNRLQSDFPISLQPYESLAFDLGITESEVMERISRLKTEGLIRRIGAIFDSKNMGYFSILCAVKAEPDQLLELGQAITALDGVTHNYIRDHQYNLWFTLTSKSAEESEEQLCMLENKHKIEILRLPAISIYKTRVMFNMEGTQ